MLPSIPDFRISWQKFCNLKNTPPKGELSPSEVLLFYAFYVIIFMFARHYFHINYFFAGGWLWKNMSIL